MDRGRRGWGPWRRIFSPYVENSVWFGQLVFTLVLEVLSVGGAQNKVFQWRSSHKADLPSEATSHTSVGQQAADTNRRLQRKPS